MVKGKKGTGPRAGATAPSCPRASKSRHHKTPRAAAKKRHGDRRFAVAALAFGATYTKWLVPAPGANACLATSHRKWHHFIVCLREDTEYALPMKYDLDEDALDEESSVSSDPDSD